jgi:hypothetical protein
MASISSVSVVYNMNIEKCLEWINENIHSAIKDNDKKNFQVFQHILLNCRNNNNILNNSGKFLLIRNGLIYNQIFDSAEDISSDEFDDECILFRIPNMGGN